MAKDLAKTLKSIQAMTRQELLESWAELHGAPHNFRARKDFLVRCLAYRQQEEAIGGLTASTRKQLRKLAAKVQAGETFSISTGTGIKPGTKLIREWQGDTHEVLALDKAFAYRGKQYSSLSKIARAITGTRWSGPRFLGLTDGVGARATGHRRG